MRAVSEGRRRNSIFDFNRARVVRWVTAAVLFGLSANTFALTIEPLAAYNLVVDSNVTSPSTYGPGAASIGAKFCNDSATDLGDVVVSIGDYQGGVGDTPGVYPVRNDASPNWNSTDLNGTGDYSLTHEGGSAGTADATRYIQSIPAGECVTQYWLVSYPRCVNVAGAPQQPPCDASIAGGVKPDDDLWLEYDLWARDGGGLLSSTTGTLTLRNEISASANKIWPNGDNKVPDPYREAIADLLGWDTITPNGTPDAYPGQLITTQGIWYDLGNVGQGFDNDGDLVPDQNAWLQPIGDASTYDPGCFRLVRTYGLVIVKLKGGGEHLIPFVDQLYFEHIPDNTGAVGLVYYQYVALNGVCSAGLTPYQEVASGFDNEKFNADFGFGIPPLQSREPEVLFDKAVDNSGPIDLSSPQTLTYSLRFENNSTDTGGAIVTVGNPALGVPLVVEDAIPSGTTYVAGSATVDQFPPGVTNTAILYYDTTSGAWQSTEPAAANVGGLRWIMNDPVGGVVGDDTGFGEVSFQVSVPTSFPAALVENLGEIRFGDAPPFAEDDAVTLVLGTNIVEGTVFEDDGGVPNTYLGNGLQESSEAGIEDTAIVSLYIKLGGEWVLFDTSDTDANGDYSFTQLPDGEYQVRVNTSELDSPAYDGWTNSTDDTLDVGAISGGATSSGYDFGFAPALSLTKTVVGSSDVYEGQLVSYEIDVSNNLAGDGTADPGGQCTSITWAAAEGATTSGINVVKKFSNPDAAYGPDELDGSFATSSYVNARDQVAGSGFGLAPQSGNVQTVEAIISFYFTGSFSSNPAQDDQVDLELYVNGVLQTNQPFEGLDLGAYSGAANQGILAWDVTALRTWAWSEFSGTTLEINVGAQKVASSDSVTLHVDGIGFRVTSSEPCQGQVDLGTISPVPLEDAYDATRFAFVGADPTPSVVDTGNGVVSWSDIGPLFPGGTRTVRVTLRALTPTGSPDTVDNEATVSGAAYANGRPANGASDIATVNLYPTGSISGHVWNDATGTTAGWVTGSPQGFDNGDSFFPSVPVSLYACVDAAGVPLDPTAVQSNKDCAQNAGSWQFLQTVYTDGSGYYRFLDQNTDFLRNGFYIVVVNGALGSGAAPFGSTQVAEANDNQAVGGITCGACNSQWGNPAANLSTANFNPIDNPSEDVTNVNFGYSTSSAVVYGNVFEDLLGDGAKDAYDAGLTGITVSLTAPGGGVVTTTTDASGNYTFPGITVNGSYTLSVDTASLPTLTTAAWAETYESDASADNSISVSVNTLNSLYYGSNDFGFYRDPPDIGDTLFLDRDGDGMFDADEAGIANVTVNLYRDSNGSGVFEPGVDSLVGASVTDANGNYLFPDVSAGDYFVAVDTGDADFPSGVLQTADPDGGNDSSSALTVTTADNLDQDFGYQYQGAIGDTLFWDANGNGQQDWNEDGIPGVTLTLTPPAGIDLGNGAGQPVETVTDAGGKYQFTGLPPGTYTVSVSAGAGTPINGAALTADPEADGLSCTDPSATGCDGQTQVTLYAGTVYSGADFGYQPPGVIGDTLWVDGNDDRMRSAGEPGVAFVRVYACLATPCNSGNAAAATQTDADGSYSFSNLADGTYTVAVETADLPSGLSPSYDADGSPDNVAASIVISGGTVTSIGGVGCTDCSLDVDFGYRYSGENSLAGTLCMDNPTPDGLCGQGASGVDSDESAFAGRTLFAYLWSDDGDDTLEAGETALVAQEDTDANGDYRFEDLPDGDIIVSVVAPDLYLQLTTATGDTPAAAVVPNPATGDTLSAYQVIADIQTVNGGVVEGVDFAFELTVDADFGDLPESVGTPVVPNAYFTTIGSGGAMHVIPQGGTSVWLGTLPDADKNGIPSVDAGGDGSDEDGVLIDTSSWTSAGGGSADISVTGSGWLVGWIDSNDDGDFTDAGEMVVSQAVSTGVGSYPFSLSGGTRLTGSYYARFRVFKEQPQFPQLAYLGRVDDGEVEDYRIQFRLDYGDAPESYDTYYDDGGGRHFLPDAPLLYMGNTPDIEADGQAVADGADNNGGNGDGADEDGLVTFGIDRSGNAGASVEVTNTSASPAQLVAWMDFNGDGIFDQNYERSLPTLAWLLDSGGNPVTVTPGPGLDPYDASFATGNIPPGFSGTVGLLWAGIDMGTLANKSYLRIRLTTDGDFFSDASPQPQGAADDGEVEDYYLDITPTLAVIGGFRAYTEKGDAVVEWVTLSEAGTVGFHVERWDEARDDFVRLNQEMLLGLLTSTAGGTYRFMDPEARPGKSYTYRLVEVEIDGNERTHGPWMVKVAGRGKGLANGWFDKEAREPDAATKARFTAAKKAKNKAKQPKGKGDRARILVGEAGLYLVTAADLAEAFGENVRSVTNWIKTGNLALSHRGQAVAGLALPDNSGLLFYAERLESIFGGNNVYWASKANGVAMSVASGGAPEPLEGGDFAGRVRVEQQVYPVTALGGDPRGDFWYWDFLAGSPAGSSLTFVLSSKGKAEAGTACIEAGLQGYYDDSASPDHRVRLRVNGAEIGGDGIWDGLGAYVHHACFDQALLVEGDNSVDVVAYKDPGVGYNLIMIDDFALRYQQLYRAEDERLWVTGGANAVISIDGFGDAGIQVFDLSDPLRPVQVEDLRIDRTAAGWQVSFAPLAPEAPYLALATGAWDVPLEVVGYAGSDLRKTNHRFDHLIIAPAELVDAAEGLAEHRNATGLKSRVVELQEVYDEFNYGIPDPMAIRDFLAFADASWKRAPRYLVLAGKGSFDYLDWQQQGGNLFPAWLVETPHGLYSCDGCYGDLDADGIPELAVGRLPVLSADELAAYTEKLIAYEAAPPGTWAERVLFVSDNADAAGDFPADSEALAEIVGAPYVAEQVSLGAQPLAEVRNSLLDGFGNRGLINYLGHGSVFYLAHERLLGLADAVAMDNGDRLPLFAALTCSVGRFEVPGWQSLSEALVLHPAGGAIAAFSPSGQSFNQDAVVLNQGLLRSLYQEEERTLGELALKAQQHYADGPHFLFMQQIYNLMGDPATVLH